MDTFFVVFFTATLLISAGLVLQLMCLGDMFYRKKKNKIIHSCICWFFFLVGVIMLVTLRYSPQEEVKTWDDVYEIEKLTFDAVAIINNDGDMVWWQISDQSMKIEEATKEYVNVVVDHKTTLKYEWIWDLERTTSERTMYLDEGLYERYHDGYTIYEKSTACD